MQPLADIVQHLPVGAIIYHQPRNHYYRIMNKTMIKKDGGGWEYGWTYTQAEKIGENDFTYRLDGEYYSRPFSLFDSDWLLAY